MDDDERRLGAHLRGEVVRGAGVERPTVTAGHGAADLPGETNVCLQAAVDYVAGLGGGVVEITAGRYVMRNSLHLRPRVTVRGAGARTVLVKAPMVTSPVTAHLGYGHYDVSVAEPQKFPVGTGIHIQDDRSGGFYTTCATVIYRDGDRLGISRFLNHDYHPGQNAVVRSVFPVVSGCGAHDARIVALAVDGRAEENGHLNGCRGGGVFLILSDRVAVRDVTVREFNGDGISFQQCRDVRLQDCRCDRNLGHGFHPGSGSTGMTMRRLVAARNGADGLYYCLRANHGLMERCAFIGNSRHGVSIGGRDTDHLIRNCQMQENGGSGVHFRPADAVMAPSRNTIEDCLIEANGRGAGDGADRPAEVNVASPVEGVVFRRNTIRPAEPVPAHWAGIRIGAEVRGLTLEGNGIDGPEDRRVVDLR